MGQKECSCLAKCGLSDLPKVERGRLKKVEPKILSIAGGDNNSRSARASTHGSSTKKDREYESSPGETGKRVERSEVP